MMCRTFTKDEAAAVLGISPCSIVNMEEDGLLKRLNIPGVHFSRRDVYALAGISTKECTPALVKRLKRQMKAQQEEIERLRGALRFIAFEASRREAEA